MDEKAEEKKKKKNSKPHTAPEWQAEKPHYNLLAPSIQHSWIRQIRSFLVAALPLDHITLNPPGKITDV